MNWSSILPAIGTFLLGPAGTVAGAGVAWLAEKVGAPEETVDAIKSTLSGMTPEQIVELKKLDIEFQKFCLDNAIRLDLAQIGVNTEDAKSASLFVSGGRPACIWIGAAGMAYAAIIEPFLRFIAQVVFGYEGAFPAVDTMITLQVLFGLLGLSGMRSYDKKQGTATK